MLIIIGLLACVCVYAYVNGWCVYRGARDMVCMVCVCASVYLYEWMVCVPWCP